MYNDDERETKRRPPASERGRENKRRIQANIHITYERSKKCTRIEHKFTCTDTEREWECGREKQHTHSTAIYTTILLCRATISKFIQCKTFHFHACKYFFLYFCPLLCVECVYFFHFWISNGGIRIWMLFHLCNFLVMHVCVCVCVCAMHCFGIHFCTTFDCANCELLHGHCAMQCCGMWCEAVLLLNSEYVLGCYCCRWWLLLVSLCTLCTHTACASNWSIFCVCFQYV